MTEQYVFARKINGDESLEGVIQIPTMKVLCFCNEANSKIIIDSLSERDKFAREFCKYSLLKLGVAEHNIDAIDSELDLYKQSLTDKTQEK